MRAVSRTESGDRRSEAKPASPMPTAANSSTGAITLRLDTPAARMAVISPSLAMRPRPIRMPTSTPNGMVSGSTGGMAQRNSASTVLGGTLLLLHQHFEQLAGGFLQEDDKGGEQRAQHCAGSDFAENVAAKEAEHVNTYRVKGGGATSGRPGLLVVARLKLQIVHNDGRRHHASFRRKPPAPIMANGAGVSINSNMVSSSPAAKMSFSERTFTPWKRKPRTNSSRPSGYTL